MSTGLRIISWNIQHGGGRRVPAILAQLKAWAPDCLVLVEYRGTAPSKAVARGLQEMGLACQEHSLDGGTPSRNALLVASRYPLERLPADGLLRDLHRWVGVRVRAPTPFLLFGMHVPNRDSGVKYAMHEAVVRELQGHREDRGIAVGDTNTGRQGIDETTRFFNRAEDQWFDTMAGAGWVDLFRIRRPQVRVASWHAPGGGGFRLDQAFVTRALEPSVESIRYDWGGPEPPSDHAAVIVDLDMGG